MKILDIASLEKNFLDKVFDLTATISNDWPNIEQIGAGKTICLLFWEPSTRTKLSFEHAAKKLGFNVLDFSPQHSSVKKGESFEDTILTLLAMQVDGFIIRHPIFGGLSRRRCKCQNLVMLWKFNLTNLSGHMTDMLWIPLAVILRTSITKASTFKKIKDM